MTETAAADGLEFRFDIARSGTTFDAHRIVHLAAEQGLQDAMKERLLRAYFTEGVSWPTPTRLSSWPARWDCPRTRYATRWPSDRFAEEVRKDEELAGRMGISAVPTFVVDRALGASGAHPPEALLELLRQGWERRAPVPVVVGGESCGAGGC